MQNLCTKCTYNLMLHWSKFANFWLPPVLDGDSIYAITDPLEYLRQPMVLYIAKEGIQMLSLAHITRYVAKLH